MSGVRPRSTAAGRPRRPEGPRRVRNGIKIGSREGAVATTPLAERFVALLERRISPAEATEGLRYARVGQIVSFEPDVDGLRARVQGCAVNAHDVVLAMDRFTPAQWDGIVDAMAGEAVYLVKLMAGELPDGLETLLATLGLALLPDESTALHETCSCPAGGACRHVAAVGYLLAERLGRDPLLLMTLRGLAAERLLERLRQARVLLARGVAAAHADPLLAESHLQPPPLESCAESFWRPGAAINELRHAPPASHVTHALLRRLGPSPLRGRFPLVGLLASVYDRVAEHAVKLRDEAEGLEDGEAAERRSDEATSE